MTQPNKVILIFIDGVGIGKKDPETNPFFKYNFRTFSDIFGTAPSLDNPFLSNDNSFVFPTNATLNIKGLPQSGTGQTSIFCGFNAPEYIGMHFGPYPYSSLLPLIKEKNIFSELMAANFNPVFLNAYPKIFFNYLKRGISRLSVTTISCNLANLQLKKAKDLHHGTALAADITNKKWIEKLLYKVRLISPELAAQRLLRCASKHDFTLFEYFYTDHLGHFRNFHELTETIDTLDRFLFYLLTNFDKQEFTLIICSDHGNFEDLSVKTHTTNPTLTIASGKYAEYFKNNVTNITHIKPAIVNIIKNESISAN